MAFAVEAFERRAEAFVHARARNEWLYQSGQRPGRGLLKLYDEDFPELTSRELWADVQDTSDLEPRRKQALCRLLAAAHVEGTTRDLAARAAGLAARTELVVDDQTLAWREAPARWPLIGDVPRRHALAEAWREAAGRELAPLLETWHEAVRRAVAALGADDWLSFWANLSGYELQDVARLADNLLQASGDVYAHALGLYLAQLELPIDDAWTADLDWALRAPRFDPVFPERSRMPVLIRAMRDLGLDLESQSSLHLEVGALPGLRVVANDIPGDVHMLLRLGGGWRDYQRSLLGVGMAEHMVLTDRSLPFWQRWLGDETPGLAYGLLLERLVRDRAWLATRLEYTASDDYRVIAHIAWLGRIRQTAAYAMYEQRLWQSEPGSALAGDYAETLSAAVRVRHFPHDYMLGLRGTPWSCLRAATQLRAEVFASQLAAFLVREFDEEWWRSSRAAHFLQDELWRVGRRHSADEILGFMGYEGFDPGVLWDEIREVLAPL
jgi:hypothetical protein